MPQTSAYQHELEQMAQLRTRLRAIADAEGGELFMDWPDRWWADAHWRCPNDHVSTSVLRSEALGCDACLAGTCRARLALTFPEDQDGSLRDPVCP